LFTQVYPGTPASDVTNQH